MLYDPARHESLRPLDWDEAHVESTIRHIVADAQARFSEVHYWPTHPRDRNGGATAGNPETPLYHGACGVIWALHYLQAAGAAPLTRSFMPERDRLLQRNRAWLGKEAQRERASFLMGDTPIRLMAFGEQPGAELEAELDALIAGNIEHPARELMWGSPGTLLAALFLHERTGDARWARHFAATAAMLWSELEWSAEHQCRYWTQDLYGGRSTYLDAVHGFVATALPLIRGRHLLDAAQWARWEQCIVNTVQRTADRLGAHANWRPELERTAGGDKRLLQFCHGAPGFVICLAGLPGTQLDDLLLAAGETTWAAGPLAKGSNLCHGTGGNGYAFLKLYRRTGESRWLDRARAFAMHGIVQTQEDAARHGQLRYSLWTGDLGFAIYLWDCLRADAQFPTLEVFYAAAPPVPAVARPRDPGLRFTSQEPRGASS